ncbi:MAG: response regulator [Treponema sp.]|jgi:CheY-like chemotaxis protein|nr:response regulator [Treponema sp.]
MVTKRELIILVDDNAANLLAGKNVLMNNKPALILLDVDMPDMNGYEVIKILKAKDETKDIPVFL